MATANDVTSTGIYPNSETQCFEAWIVDPNSGDRVLVATCSMCVPHEQYRWWEQQVWSHWMPQWGIYPRCAKVA
ncbi:MAG: hypothetical protein AB1505_11245 [Candidatus Latescibacterota bacterium]